MFKASFVFCLIVVGTLAGCHNKQKTPLDTLVVALDAEPATLDPRYATDANGMRITNLLFNGIVRLGPQLEPIPDAAERWSYKDHVYTFYLRRDLRFHNGRPLAPEDVEFSFAQYLKPNGPFASALDIIKNVRVERHDGQIIVAIALTNFSDKFLKSDLPIVKLLPKRELSADSEAFARDLIGTGPYRFIQQTANEIQLDRTDERRETPHLLFKVIRDDFTRYQKTMQGEVDIAQMTIPPEKVADFSKHPDQFQVFIYPGLSMSYLLINFRDPWLRQKKVRQALARSIHRDDLIRYKMHELASPATSILTPNNAYFNPQLANLSYDLAAARKLLVGLLPAGAELTLKTSNTPQAVDNGKVLAYQMSQSGLKVQVQSYEWGTFYDDVRHGNFQLATMRWVGVVDPDIYRLAFSSEEKPPGRNRGSYFNPELDELLKKGTMEEDIMKRKKIFAQVQAIVLEDLAIIPLWYDQQNAIARRGIVGYKPDQTGGFDSLLEAKKIHD